MFSKIILSAIIIVFHFDLTAQAISFAPEYCINDVKFSSEFVENNYKSRQSDENALGFTAGISYQITVSTTGFFEIGLNFSQLNKKFSTTETRSEGAAFGNQRMNGSYIHVPIDYYKEFSTFFILGGVSPGVRINSKSRVEEFDSNENLISSYKSDYTHYRPLMLNLEASAGMTFSISNNRFRIGPVYRYSLFGIRKSGTITRHFSSIGLSLAWVVSR